MKRFVFVFLCLLLVLSGCGKDGKTDVQKDGMLMVYCLTGDEKSITFEYYSPAFSGGNELIEELIIRLKRGNEEEHQAAIPSVINLPDYKLSNNGIVTLTFDETYSRISGVREVLMRAAIVKTLCQTGDVDSVEFYIGSRPLTGSQGSPIGIMKADDFIESTLPDSESFQNIYTTLYFADETGKVLLASERIIPCSGSEKTVDAVLRSLISGPLENGKYAVLPENIKVRSTTVKDGTCIVDFDSTFLEKLPGLSEEVVVYAVVNSLVELKEIQRVQFLINGSTYKLFQKIDLSMTFERNLNIVENE